jgi:hypothetical protein
VNVIARGIGDGEASYSSISNPKKFTFEINGSKTFPWQKSKSVQATISPKSEQPGFPVMAWKFVK